MTGTVQFEDKGRSGRYINVLPGRRQRRRAGSELRIWRDASGDFGHDSEPPIKIVFINVSGRFSYCHGGQAATFNFATGGPASLHGRRGEDRNSRVS